MLEKQVEIELYDADGKLVERVMVVESTVTRRKAVRYQMRFYVQDVETSKYREVEFAPVDYRIIG